MYSLALELPNIKSLILQSTTPERLPLWTLLDLIRWDREHGGTSFALVDFKGFKEEEEEEHCWVWLLPCACMCHVWENVHDVCTTNHSHTHTHTLWIRSFKKNDRFWREPKAGKILFFSNCLWSKVALLATNSILH